MKKQIPNMLSALRLIMVPAFVICYFKCKTEVSVAIYISAWLTDALDGYLARRNNWITDLGKILDPLADKLMQLAAAICFAVENKIFLMVALPLIAKDTLMLLASMKIRKQHNVVVVSRWYGKVVTVLLFICAFTRLVVRNNPVLDVVLATVMLICMIFSFFMYYFNDYKGKYN